ncbi:MAG: DUF2851 family protein, partial [Bacteroidota bacterium]
PYWTTRYMFDKAAPYSCKTLGSDSIDNIIINTIAPAMFYYGRMRCDHAIVDKSMDLLRSISPEKNSILSKWNNTGLVASNAYESQALIGLYDRYCSHKKCLDCAIGKVIISEPSVISNVER